LTAEFRLTYGQFDQPQTGTIELLIMQGPPEDVTTTSAPVARRVLTIDDLAALGRSDVINVAELNVELELVASQQQALGRRAEKWSGR
jgi:hypothetical protein